MRHVASLRERLTSCAPTLLSSIGHDLRSPAPPPSSRRPIALAGATKISRSCGGDDPWRGAAAVAMTAVSGLSQIVADRGEQGLARSSSRSRRLADVGASPPPAVSRSCGERGLIDLGSSAKQRVGLRRHRLARVRPRDAEHASVPIAVRSGRNCHSDAVSVSVSRPAGSPMIERQSIAAMSIAPSRFSGWIGADQPRRCPSPRG